MCLRITFSVMERASKREMLLGLKKIAVSKRDLMILTVRERKK
jgi:hypothetical protein